MVSVWLVGARTEQVACNPVPIPCQKNPPCPYGRPINWGCAVIFCLRFMNFCVLAALGVVLLAPAARPDRSIDRLVPGYSARTASISGTLAWQGADRLMVKLAGVKAEIHDDVCRHDAFVLLRVRDCGPRSDS